jgi:hypothetical protein
MMNSDLARSSKGSVAGTPKVMTGVLLVGHGGFDKLEYRETLSVQQDFLSKSISGKLVLVIPE